MFRKLEALSGLCLCAGIACAGTAAAVAIAAACVPYAASLALFYCGEAVDGEIRRRKWGGK